MNGPGVHQSNDGPPSGQDGSFGARPLVDAGHTLNELRGLATGSVIAFNDHVESCSICDRPPVCTYLCPAGRILEDEAQMWCALKLRAEGGLLGRTA